MKLSELLNELQKLEEMYGGDLVCLNSIDNEPIGAVMYDDDDDAMAWVVIE